MIYLHYKDTKTFGHSFSFLLIFNALSANYLQVGNFSQLAAFSVLLHKKAALLLKDYASDNQKNRFQRTTVVNHRSHAATIAILPPLLSHQNTSISHRPTGVSS